MRYLRRFADLGGDDVALAGGTGATLGELTRAGLPVPPGFVLTTDAYRAFVGAAGIGDAVLAAAGDGPAAHEERSRRIRELFASAPVPDDVAAALVACRAELGPAVAVRSSATAEDLAEASFAGQQDTFLNVRGTDALLARVRDCWASLWTARALAYRERHSVDPATVALAVVVQEMVDADAAGVLFTANPTTGRRDDLVVDKGTGRVRSRTTADKAVMTVATDAGTEERPVPAERRARPVLDDDQAAALAALGARIEEWFGAPQDVEWARGSGGFRIVQ